LFEACFRPAAAGVFPDRPATPLRKVVGEGESLSAAAAAVAPPPPKPKAVYRPPGSTGALAAMLRAEREAVAGPKKIVNGRSVGGGITYVAPGGQPYIPGLAPAATSADSKNAAKNKARKEKKKAADTVAKAQADAEAEKAKEEAAAAAAAAEDPVKRKKAFQKKLKQIDDLKARAAGGEELNEDQQQKLASEVDLREQMAKLAV